MEWGCTNLHKINLVTHMVSCSQLNVLYFISFLLKILDLYSLASYCLSYEDG